MVAQQYVDYFIDRETTTRKLTTNRQVQAFMHMSFT